MPKDDLVTTFGYQVQLAADWQRQKAKELAGDIRHQKAAEELERLYAEIEELCGLPIEEDISDLDVRLRGAVQEIRKEVSDQVDNCLGSIGFTASFENGLSLVEWYRELLQKRLPA